VRIHSQYVVGVCWLPTVFGFSLQTYGAEVDQLRADFGATVAVAQVEQALQSKKYKIVTITHVDTSTGSVCFSNVVISRVSLSSQACSRTRSQVAEAVKKISPDTLVVIDAVCAVASEEIQMDNWGIDVVITASQKGLGAPPGLSIVVVSEKALKVERFSC
jgi:alanine-glyoxylate transaminase/serine-glyoxylate transaminase/serine-pyruvate transaminase